MTLRNGDQDNVVSVAQEDVPAKRSRQTMLRPSLGWGLSAAFVAALGATSARSFPTSTEEKAPARKAPGDAPVPGTVAGLAPEDLQAFATRFEKELWPVMEAQCAPCHAQKNASQFLLAKEPRAAFLKMIGEGHFDSDNHSSTVERVTTTDKEILMPPPQMGKMAQKDIVLFEKFSEELRAKRKSGPGMKADENFPPHLMISYTGKRKAGGPDNTFVSFRQLRGKVKTIFGDEWARSDRNLFIENVHLFQGADFVKRFDESTKPAATFLTGVDMMGRDVASQAYLNRTGPFAGFAPEKLPSPVGLKAPSPGYQQAINRLYRRMLFRDATPTEMQQAFGLIQSIYRNQAKLAETAPQDVRFALTVKDDAGMSVIQEVVVRATATSPGQSLYQEFLDQSKDAADKDNKTSTYTLAQPLTFKPGVTGQKVVLTNENTHGNVSIASVTLRGPLPAKTEKVITVEDTSVRPEGAWNIKKENGFTSYEDNNENKGDSHIAFPVNVKEAGKYEVAITWRRFPSPEAPPPGQQQRRRSRGPANGAENVLVEVVSMDAASRLATPPAPPVPPKGEAHFYIDQTVDTIPYADLKTAFRFGEGENEGVEVRNENTRKPVVADAVTLLPPRVQDGGKAAVILRAADATVGQDRWFRFKDSTFRAYNSIGPALFSDIEDNGTKRPDIGLLFRPALAKKSGFDPAKFYRVGVVYPGRVQNETRVPIVVRAAASSPIVRVVAPYHAFVGAPVTVDASATYNLQHTPLRFSWKQIGGPRVRVADASSPKLSFTAPGMTASQAAWEGICRALLSHPDFLFTRPRSLALVKEEKQRRRLQLVKIAQDLVARTPTVAEMAKVDAGTPLAELVDSYLKSPEFKDFYYHRVRLYLESHGTPEQDEPARIWTWIALNDRPFKEILTGDYTIGTDWQKKARPPYHGKTGVLTTKGFIIGKPGLPHFNYPAQVLEKFLGYVFEVPDEILQARDGITAAATTDPNSVCYTCHKVLTPLAYQRLYWDDEGNYRIHDDTGLAMDATDRNLVASYPYKGNGIEAFALQAQNKERFIRTILQNHFVWYFGRELRYDADERTLYRRLWDVTRKNQFAIRPLIRAIVLSPEYLNGLSQNPPPAKPAILAKKQRVARLGAWHQKVVTPSSTAGVSTR